MTKNYKINRNILMIISVCFLIIAFSFNPLFYTQVTLDGITIWALTILPSLFFYFVLTNLFLLLNNSLNGFYRLDRVAKGLFNTRGIAFYGLFISMLCGYPAGSKVTASLYENNIITYDEAVKMSGFTSTSGVMFILSTLGNIVGRKSALFILIAHFLSVVSTALIFRGKRKDLSFAQNRSYLPLKNVDNLLYDAIYDSIQSVVVLGGIVVFYYVLSEMLFSTFVLYVPVKILSFICSSEQMARGILSGVIECISGIKKISMVSYPYKTAIIGGIISFGGLSVLTQSMVFLKRAKIKTAQFILSKITQAVLCFLMLFVLTILKIL